MYNEGNHEKQIGKVKGGAYFGEKVGWELVKGFWWECLGRHLLVGCVLLLMLLCFQGISSERNPRNSCTPAASVSLHFGTMMELPLER